MTLNTECTGDSLSRPHEEHWKPYDPPPDITKSGFYVGTSGYYFDDWIGRFNPPKTSPSKKPGLTDEEKADQDRLRFYQKYFSFVEINNTFYREPVREAFAGMEARSKESMMYAVKVHKDISHTKAWDPAKGMEMMKQHVSAVGPLVETGRFYSFLIQLEDHVNRSQQKLDYLTSVASEAVKRKVDVHVEFRHNSWHHQHVLQTLKDNGVGICNTEIPPVRHAFPLKAYATTDKGYIRYSGRNLANWYPKGKQNSAKERIASRNARYDYLYSSDEVRERAKGQEALGTKTRATAIAYNNHYQTKAVLNAIENIRILKDKLGLG